MRALFFSALLCGLPLAQAKPNCPAKPKTVAAMRDCYRPVLVFSPSGSDPRLREQERLLDGAADDMMDRNMLLVLVLGGGAFAPPLDAPFAFPAPQEAAKLRQRFGVEGSGFKVVLLGEDGGAKLRSSKPVPAERFNSLIDTMPTRRREMERPHSN